jgi:glycosyltransferase involved in cell wall biosynthesis
MNPKVSILLPNLNNCHFLDERLRTIVNQTFSDWELIIIDNYSDDGAWEVFKEWAQKDNRIKISQAPRNGMYANWNNCIRKAKGDYIYVATSDDTMEPELLEIMITALKKFSNCDIAHCNLRIIDENGDGHPSLTWEQFFGIDYFGDLMNKIHIRHAPHDGLLHCCLGTLYTSITQLLIRRRLFDQIGLFLTGYGSIADFEWEMRASLLVNTIHIPLYLATWRVHKDQGTNFSYQSTSKHRAALLEMMDHAFCVAEGINPILKKHIKKDPLKFWYTKEKYLFEAIEQDTITAKLKYYFFCLYRTPSTILWYNIILKLLSKSMSNKLQIYEYCRRLLSLHNCRNSIRY